MNPPVLDDLPGISKILEAVLVQQVITECAIEGLYKGVLGGFAGLDEEQNRVSLSQDQKNIALEVSSGPLSPTTDLGNGILCPRLFRKRARRAPVIEVRTT